MSNKSIFITILFALYLLLQGACGSLLDNHTQKAQKKLESLKQTDVTMTLIPSSCVVEKDTLYFDFVIKNNTPKQITIYHPQTFYTMGGDRTIEEVLNKDPRTIMYLYDNELNLVEDEVMTLGGTPKKRRPVKAYTTLDRYESKMFEGAYYVGGVYLLKGEYKLNLKYLSSKSRIDDVYKREQKANPELKNFQLFYGLIISDTIPFMVKEDIIHPFYKRHKTKE